MQSNDPHTPVSPGGRRPRTGSRSFSVRSDKSNGPVSPAERAEKERRDSFLRGESKANPNAAISELQPASRNVMEKVTLDSLRNIQAKDAQGNAIAEPDLSNPTRPRWERPLDTIRSFEKAIDGEYSRRSHQRSQSEYDQPQHHYASRRGSYMGGHGGPNGGRYNGMSGYYNRPDSQYDNYGGAPPLPRQRFGRGMSEGAMGRGPGYNGPQYGHYNGSYETNNSDSTGPWMNSTDPSSQNSSFERLHGAAAANGNNGKGQSPEHNYGMHDGYGNGSTTIQEETDAYGFPPAPPPKGQNGSPLKQRSEAQPPRVPIKLGGGGDSEGRHIPHQGGSLPSNATPKQEKRQSWLGRRFSKKN
ncbi:hypothetical protein KVT40_008188 [Elsinoe batatas]|uniref:Uncharacterized protein n=1 Tax=Elsinoe batatas TaxID=2601811 RepID=A0A8K0KU35_9PEZI|nr:hypothetical protein KVT40_008188 [Elsinoe batatas]